MPDPAYLTATNETSQGDWSHSRAHITMQNQAQSTGANDMVFAHIAGIWVSGQVKHQTGDVLTIDLVTGNTIHRLQTEVKTVSPRLENPSDWPL